MPRKTVAVNYRACEPEKCEDGICLAALVCEKNILIQEAPYEMPDTKASSCLSCAICVQACPQDAVLVM
ncbi:MAG: 4Fe-4S binding protein [Anaerolineales bacterium]|uniref:4Fe-4S binding protein n=1 Tax=Candidatus Desulfolinea nitratireducens TaxID=2841698 RepID=A0A8J6NIF1_9CHLR|nr:4Fe-4S binding protein [Candidatus Desulfolinea nitratireducens]MBL6961402.1 4Fe-4S binding protein [Anaerolineales bacterium]